MENFETNVLLLLFCIILIFVIFFLIMFLRFCFFKTRSNNINDQPRIFSIELPTYKQVEDDNKKKIFTDPNQPISYKNLNF